MQLDADGTWDWISQAVPITPRRRSLRQSSISVPSPKDRALALQSVWQSTSRYNTKVIPEPFLGPTHPARLCSSAAFCQMLRVGHGCWT